MASASRKWRFVNCWTRFLWSGRLRASALTTHSGRNTPRPTLSPPPLRSQVLTFFLCASAPRRWILLWVTQSSSPLSLPRTTPPALPRIGLKPSSESIPRDCRHRSCRPAQIPGRSHKYPRPAHNDMMAAPRVMWGISLTSESSVNERNVRAHARAIGEERILETFAE